MSLYLTSLELNKQIYLSFIHYFIYLLDKWMKWEATGKNKLIDKAPSHVTDTWILRLLVKNLFLASQVKYAAWSLSNSEKCNDELIFSARFSSWRETERLRSPSLTSMPFMNHLTFGRGQPVTLRKKIQNPLPFELMDCLFKRKAKIAFKFVLKGTVIVVIDFWKRRILESYAGKSLTSQLYFSNL